MQEINGREIAQSIFDGLKKLKPPKKFLAVFLVGNDPSSVSFIKQKEKRAKELGVDFRLYLYPAEIKNDDLRQRIRQVVERRTCGAAIIQLPLPAHLSVHYALNAIPANKDADVLSERAIGAFYVGRNPVLPPAVASVGTILEQQRMDLRNLRVAVVGSGLLVGKPLAVWLMGKCRQLYVLGRRSDFEILKQADLVISGAGEPGLIKPEMLKPGSGVIDFGYSPDKNGKISGDLDTSSSLASLSFYTPTPGGTGPIVVAKLFENFYYLAGDDETKN